MVKRIYIEKKTGYDVHTRSLSEDLRNNLKISGITSLRLLERYDIEGITDEQYKAAKKAIFTDAAVNTVYDEELVINNGEKIFASELLPGQYDQRADFIAQAIQILSQGEPPLVRAADVIIVSGVTDAQLDTIKAYCINSIEAHEASLDKYQSIKPHYAEAKDVATVDGFIGMSDGRLTAFANEFGLAMDLDDVKLCQNYFKNDEKRDPTVTEMKMLDTYWSDHCRHTTFLTKFNKIEFEDKLIEAVYNDYLASRDDVYGDKKKNITLMDMATIAAKKLKKQGKLTNIDESEEVNACSIKIDVDIDGEIQPWLVMFKNETHNHPTEMEPFGGASTCLGGAIRDPMSGRVFVYQAMRITGCGDPRSAIEDTISGKLPQKKITTTAAAGYSSYGNQAGAATGYVNEIYDEGYVAKRMELGALVGAAPQENVVRETPQAGDVVILLGGKTGRDGCGGATGSSKAQTEDSLSSCGAEVQKGTPSIGRKIMRLFRNPEVSKLIKRCNDFGAGGVSVAVGELADGLLIELDNVPVKYDGMSGTEVAISESQERMAVVVNACDVPEFSRLARLENLAATQIATVTDNNRVEMIWQGRKIVDLSRSFLNTNGAEKSTEAIVTDASRASEFFAGHETSDVRQKWLETLTDLNVCCQRGLVDRFDSSASAGTVNMPFGGKTQLSPSQAMTAKIPVQRGETKTGTAMAYGFNPKLSRLSPFHGAMYAVVESVAKIVASGADYSTAYLTFQEYFERLGSDATRWGKPLSALLGAYHAQMGFGIAAIGGKDSMSGSYGDIDVPPTLVSFAINAFNTDDAVSTDFKKQNSNVVLLKVKSDENNVPDFADLCAKYDKLHNYIKTGRVLSSYAVTGGGLCEAISKMSFGNKIGFDYTGDVSDLFKPMPGAIVLELDGEADLGEQIGTTTTESHIKFAGTKLEINKLLESWTKPLEKIYPRSHGGNTRLTDKFGYDKRSTAAPSVTVAKPRVLIPVSHGTSSEYDLAMAFEKAGAQVDTFVFKNLTAADISQSINELAKKIGQAQIVTLSGGYSPESGVDLTGGLLAAAFEASAVKEEINNLLSKRDGLMLGINNGFAVLLKLGLLPYGEFRDVNESSPTLTFNKLGRHVSTMASTRVASTLSPWLSNANVGDIGTVAISTASGRFVVDDDCLKTLARRGQIATQYVDFDGNATNDVTFNPCGSTCAIEGITNADGRILGRIAHAERFGDNVAKNIAGNKDQLLFKAGVEYFK